MINSNPSLAQFILLVSFTFQAACNLQKKKSSSENTVVQSDNKENTQSIEEVNSGEIQNDTQDEIQTVLPPLYVENSEDHIQKSEMLEVRNKGYVVSALLDSGLSLISGGLGGGCEWGSRNLRTTEYYDSKTEIFSRGPNMIYERSFHSAIELKNSDLLISGGDTCTFNGVFGWLGVSQNSAEVYDPETRTFHEVSPMKDARTQHFGVALSNGDALIVGGYRNHNPLNSVEYYSSKNESFTKLDDVPGAHYIYGVETINSSQVIIDTNIGKINYKIKKGF